MKVRKNVNINKPYQFDELKTELLEHLVKEIGETKLVFVVSPTIYGQNEDQLIPVKDLCNKYSIPLYDFSNDTKYVHNAKYFKDGSHLNAVGADVFTRELMHTMKNQ